jgi:hypothetical protein
MPTVVTNDRAPITSRERSRLERLTRNVKQAAIEKGLDISEWENQRETQAARDHFELGCWLYYYSKRLWNPGSLKERIDCVRRIYEAGYVHLGYDFYTVFDFGERHYDSIMEMGDGAAVVDGLRQYMMFSTAPDKLIAAFTYNNWPLTNAA